ncbi:transmembrane 9 superfamily member 2-like isoform X3 [Camellia sinensis]|uniref:transmembrane 9 superfamily member 2-like isoform X3 n=1 Tax=Camellia sinensis TaxID=4442 RepID=UPI0010355F18|nr:transmembrane 9 superfamily member 2-like isoform X3 [Camellia sinensis]
MEELPKFSQTHFCTHCSPTKENSKRRMEESSAIILVAFLVICCASEVRSDASNHRYNAGDPVPCYSNKVGPFHNPSETYAYYDFPFCLPEHVKEKKESLGEVLIGDRLASAPYKIDFLVEKDAELACKKKLKKEEVSQFRTALAQDYYIEMYFDDLPAWAFIGKVDRPYLAETNDYKYLLFTHMVFEFLYNKEHVIEITARIDQSFVIDLTEDKEVNVEFTYTVKWRETNIAFEKRMEKYSSSSSLPRHLRIHWFAVMNSCLAVLILLGCLVMFYVRVLKKDINKYANDEELLDNQEEKGWKNIHGDVFRYPKHKSLFAAAVGSGTQLFILMLSIIMLGFVGVFYPYSRGALLTALVVVYAITSGIAGYTAVSLYCQFEGTNWVRNLLLTGCLFCGPLCLTFCFLNTVAITYRATAALPLGTILVLLSIWVLVALPLLLLGGIAAKNSKSEFQAPCRTTKYPREIPPQCWYRGILPQMAVAGILPFGVIYVELYYLFATIWGHRIYTIYGILFNVFIILVIVTAFVNVVMTYFRLAAENHEWWWRPDPTQPNPISTSTSTPASNLPTITRSDHLCHPPLLFFFLLFKL